MAASIGTHSSSIGALVAPENRRILQVVYSAIAQLDHFNVFISGQVGGGINRHWPASRGMLLITFSITAYVEE